MVETKYDGMQLGVQGMAYRQYHQEVYIIHKSAVPEVDATNS